MRISDWSSDVCSSDLCPAWIRTTIDGVRVRSLAVRRRGNKARDLGGGFPRVKGTIGRAARRLLRRMCDACCRIPFDDCHRPFKVVLSSNELGSADPARGRGSLDAARGEIGRAHVCTPVTNAHLVCRLLLAKKKQL